MNVSCNSISDIEEVAEANQRRSGQKDFIETGIANLADEVRSTCPNVLVAKRSLAADFTPGPVDVILARGKKAYNHAGNRRLRQLINENMKAYSEAPSKVDKSFIVSKIMDAVRQASNGGGFVREEDGKWCAVGDRLAREKISSSFRDLLHTKYRSSTKAKAKLKAKAKENTQCKDRQRCALNAHFQSGPIERNAMQHREEFSRILPSDSSCSKPNTLEQAEQHPESDHGGIQEEKVTFEQPSGTNGYHSADVSPAMPFPFDSSGSDITPPVTSKTTSNRYSFAACDFLDMATRKEQNDTIACSSLDEVMDRPFFPIHDASSDVQPLDLFPDEGRQPMNNEMEGFLAIEWNLNSCLVL